MAEVYDHSSREGRVGIARYKLVDRSPGRAPVMQLHAITAAGQYRQVGANSCLVPIVGISEKPKSALEPWQAMAFKEN